ncbi:hypothetical protein E3E35_00150 [Thermococcus sp. GR7]|uniref:hypothetical protein n=1 Tax=unclassified Thermococcus TaxID=2627626 RepID=UPI001430B9D5|nr:MULTISPECIES: hypothetical protein [unclassified Thermococcus]NJE45845.1 hypothetical protein [Thermococcus sp. GR7]NJE79193.1 hypothetical protein [Thermococcus sp. GR4]NJF22039.1 hypothetical protein [Thermococcus sp. GR5]
MAHFHGHWIEDILIVAIGLLALASLLTGVKWLTTLAGTLFWVSLPTLLFGRGIKIENGIILEFGWPMRLFRIRIAPDDIVEIVDLERAEGIPLIRYYRQIIIFTALWLVVGFTGLIKRPEWAFMWFGWIYWGLASAVPLIFPGRTRKLGALALLLFGVLMSGVAYHLGVNVYQFYAIGGALLAFVYLTDVREKTIVLVTEKGTYFVCSYNYDELEEFLERIGKLVSGGADAQAT